MTRTDCVDITVCTNGVLTYDEIGGHLRPSGTGNTAASRFRRPIPLSPTANEMSPRWSYRWSATYPCDRVLCSSTFRAISSSAAYSGWMSSGWSST